MHLKMKCSLCRQCYDNCRLSYRSQLEFHWQIQCKLEMINHTHTIVKGSKEKGYPTFIPQFGTVL